MTMSQQIIEVLDHIGDQIGIAVDWSQENLFPWIQDLSNRIVVYEINTSLAWIFIMLVPTCIIAAISYKVYKNASKKEKITESDECAFGVCIVLLLIFGVVTIFVSASQILDIIEATTIPEKVILKFLQSYM